MMPNFETQSYARDSTQWVEQTVSTSTPTAEKDLLICFLTIKAYRDLLSDPNTDLIDDMTQQFIDQVMLPDFKVVIWKLRDYAGFDRRGVNEARSLMEEALLKLSLASRALQDQDTYRSLESRFKALLLCRENLTGSYLQLEHLNSVLEKLSSTSEVAEDSTTNALTSQDKRNKKPSRSKSKYPIEPPADKPPDKHKGDTSDEVSFTAFHPEKGAVNKWYTLLVYAHLVFVIEKVRQDAKRFRDQLPRQIVTESTSSTRIARGSEIRIIPYCEGVRFNPPHREVEWWEDYHRLDFRFCANNSLCDRMTNGHIDVMVGPLIVGSLRFAMLFNEQDDISSLVHEEQSTMFSEEKIFISYSHKDTDLVLAFKKVHEATGFDVFIDIEDLRSGQDWNKALMKMIDQADIFQLFWSENSKSSKYCRQEWKHALERDIEGFVRPVYWHKPIPNPPKELKKYHFAYVEF